MRKWNPNARLESTKKGFQTLDDSNRVGHHFGLRVGTASTLEEPVREVVWWMRPGRTGSRGRRITNRSAPDDPRGQPEREGSAARCCGGCHHHLPWGYLNTNTSQS